MSFDIDGAAAIAADLGSFNEEDVKKLVKLVKQLKPPPKGKGGAGGQAGSNGRGWLVACS